mgnify:CR=1 FL=1
MNYTTSDRSAVSPDGGRTSLPLTHPEVTAFLDAGGQISDAVIIELHDDRDYIKEVERAETVNEALDLFKLRFAEPAPDLDTLTDQALEDRPDLFSNTEPVDPEKEALREQVADLQRQLAERDAEPPPLSPDPVKHMIPDEIRKLMEDGESLSNAKRRLTELLWVEQAELRNLRGTDRGDLKREAEIERLLGLFARLGEI